MSTEIVMPKQVLAIELECSISWLLGGAGDTVNQVLFELSLKGLTSEAGEGLRMEAEMLSCIYKQSLRQTYGRPHRYVWVSLSG